MIKLNRNRFLQALALARVVVKSKATLPVLGCVRLEVVAGRLEVRATDLDSEVVCELDLEGKGDLLAVVSCVKLSCFLAVCDGEDVELEVRKKLLLVTAGEARCSLLVVDPDEFPATRAAEVASGTNEFSPHELLGLLNTVFCASDDATRYALTGLYFCGVDKVLSVVATDGRRLAVRVADREPVVPIAAIVPSAAVKLMQAVLRSALVDGAVDLGFSEHRAFLSAGDVRISSKLIEGEYPNWRQVVPEDKRGIVFSPVRLMAAVERAAALQQDSVQIEMKGSAVRVLGEAAEYGTAEDQFALDLGGASSVVSLNAEFVLQGLKWCGDADADIVPGNGMEPVVLMPAGGRAKYVVMPLRQTE